MAALNALYTDLRLFQNLFPPSMKLVRHASRLRRHYDLPQTPWARRLACTEADPVKVAGLRCVLARIDPFALSARIDTQLERLWTLANRATREPRATLPKAPQSRGGPP